MEIEEKTKSGIEDLELKPTERGFLRVDSCQMNEQ